MPDYGMLSSGLSSFHPLNAIRGWPIRRLIGRRRPGAAAGAWPAASRHRHRRLGPPAGRLVRVGQFQAGQRTRADRSALYRPRRGPLTRSVADAALTTLAQRDDHDYMSLPPENLDWHQRRLRLRIGLLLEPAAASDIGADARGARTRRAFRYRRRRRRATPFLTRTCWTGSTPRSGAVHFAPRRRSSSRGSSFIRAWGESAADFSGETIFTASVGHSRCASGRDGNASV
jgi:aspartyl-tRNA(Asn)/glutamyl-tRNA(Gln) amidotransferase subunit A